MRLSQAFQPTLKEVPAEAQIMSHRLMLRAGLIRQTSSGIYIWLPAGLKVLNNIAHIIRQEQNAAGAQEILMPTLQSADLWKRSGRYEAYGPEMLRILDRQKRELLYGPTNEEVVTDLFGSMAKSYRELPKTLYHIQWKFRDEIRPRFGVMRGREFYMKDGYSFDETYEGAVNSYYRMMLSYLRIFRRLGIKAVPTLADTGPIGGNLSHEFQVLAPTGESEVFYDTQWDNIDWDKEGLDLNRPEDLKKLQSLVGSTYAATDEKHDISAWEKVPQERRASGRGIEVGHIFYFGTKYTEAMNVKIKGSDGESFYPHMGSYGVGVSRLVGAVIEASHDDSGIIWPESIAPYRAVILNLRVGDEACDAMCEQVYAADVENILYDDRSERAGVKFNDADLMGHPWQIIVGPRGAKNGVVELKYRATGERFELSAHEALSKIGYD